jgi:hypothetical protein
MDIKVNRMLYISRANRLDMIYIRDLQLALAKQIAYIQSLP